MRLLRSLSMDGAVRSAPKEAKSFETLSGMTWMRVVSASYLYCLLLEKFYVHTEYLDKILSFLLCLYLKSIMHSLGITS